MKVPGQLSKIIDLKLALTCLISISLSACGEVWTSFGSSNGGTATKVAYDNSAFCNIGGGCIAYGASAVATYPLTVSSASKRAIVVFTEVSGAIGGGGCGPVNFSVSSVTYAGVSLNAVVTNNIFATICGGPQTDILQLWSLPAGIQPTPGTNNVVVTLSAILANTGRLQSGAISATGVNQTTTFTSTASNNFGVGSPVTLNLPSSGPNDLVVSFVYNGDSITSAIAPLTQLWINNTSINSTGDNSGGAVAVGGTSSLSWNVNAPDGSSGIVAASLKAAP